MEPEDEFECLNLEITGPPVSVSAEPLPVLVWIHGSSNHFICIGQFLTYSQVALKLSLSAQLRLRSAVSNSGHLIPQLF